MADRRTIAASRDDDVERSFVGQEKKKDATVPCWGGWWPLGLFVHFQRSSCRHHILSWKYTQFTGVNVLCFHACVFCVTT